MTVHVRLVKPLFVLIVLTITLFLAAAVGAQRTPEIVVGPNIMVSRDYGLACGEHFGSIDPANPKRIQVSAACLFPYFEDDNFDVEKVVQRNYISTDGGITWKTIPLENQRLRTDPMTAFGIDGSLIALGISDESDHALGVKNLLVRSEDGGTTWSKPYAFSEQMDRPILAVDHTTSRFRGNAYVQGWYSDKASGARLTVVYRSHDNGKSWLGPVVVSNTHKVPELSEMGINATSLMIFSDGELFVPFFTFPTRKNPDRTGGRRVQSFFTTSKDGGETFRTPRSLRIKGGGEMFSADMPYFAVDNSTGHFKDRLYIVWTDNNRIAGDNSDSKLWISNSSDRGVSWEKPLILADSPESGGRFMPSIAVNNEGVVAVSWDEIREKDGGMKVRYISASSDGGSTFSPPVKVSSIPSPAWDRRLSAVASSAIKVKDRVIEGSLRVRSVPNARDYSSMMSDPDGNFRVFWWDSRYGGGAQIWTSTVSIFNGTSVKKEPANRTTTDVSDRVKIVLDPPLQLGADLFGLPVRIKNISDRNIYGPVIIETNSGKIFAAVPELPNAVHTPQGARFDYSGRLGTLDTLAPGELSEAVMWHFKLPPPTGPFWVDYDFKVTGQIDQK